MLESWRSGVGKDTTQLVSGRKIPLNDRDRTVGSQPHTPCSSLFQKMLLPLTQLLKPKTLVPFSKPSFHSSPPFNPSRGLTILLPK